MTVAESQEIFIRALCIWREMRGESDQARLGCYWVICNRMLDRQNRWPKTLYEVVTQHEQFSSFNPRNPNAALLPKKVNAADWQAWLDIQQLCDQPGPDPAGGANMYEAEPDGAPRPAWAQANRLTVQIGKTRFYKI